MLTGESVPSAHSGCGVCRPGPSSSRAKAEATVDGHRRRHRLGRHPGPDRKRRLPRTALRTVQLHRLVRVIAIIAVGVGVSLVGVSMLLGLGATKALLFGVGVMVALVPEGLLPTVTLSLARARNGWHTERARPSAGRRRDPRGDDLRLHRQDRHSDDESDVGAGGLDPAGTVVVDGEGYSPDGERPRSGSGDGARGGGRGRAVTVRGRAVRKGRSLGGRG